MGSHDLSYTRSINNARTWTNKYYENIATQTFYNSFRSDSSSPIPKYAKINSAYFDCTFTTNWTIQTVDLQMGFGTKSGDESATMTVTFYDQTHNSSESYSVGAGSSTGKTYTSSNIASYFNSETSSAGKPSYTDIIGYLHTSSGRTLKWISQAVRINYTDPSYYIVTSRNNSTYGTVTSGSTTVVTKSTSVAKTLTATPNDHYHFVRWEWAANNTFGKTAGTVYSTNPTISISITENALNNFATKLYLKAIFEIDTAEITGTVIPDGSGSINNLGTYNHLENIFLLATPAAGWEFRYWGDGTSTNPLAFQVTGDKAVTAIFHKLPEIYMGNDRIKALYIGNQQAKTIFIGQDQVLWE